MTTLHPEYKEIIVSYLENTDLTDKRLKQIIEDLALQLPEELMSNHQYVPYIEPDIEPYLTLTPWMDDPFNELAYLVDSYIENENTNDREVLQRVHNHPRFDWTDDMINYALGRK